jgi:ribosome-associated translation inhibitor RaiA
MATEYTDFPIELVIDIEHREPLSDQTKDDLYALAERELRKLAKGNTDITGANVMITAPAEKGNIPFYEATVSATVRPKNMAACERANSPMEALRSALHALERQVRSKREKLRGH